MRALIGYIAILATLSCWFRIAEHPGQQGYLHERSIHSIKNLFYADPTFDSYDQGYFEGWKKAEEEIVAGKASFYSQGGLVIPGALFQVIYLEKGSGLPIRYVTGCVITSYSQGLVNGHNDRIKRYLDVFGLPSYSRKSHYALIENPKVLFATVPTTIAALKPNQQPIMTSDSGYSFWLETNPDGQYAKLTVAQPDSTLKEYHFWHGVDSVCFKWGPQKSDLIAIQFTDRLHHDSVACELFDLRECQIIKIGREID